MAAKKKTDQRSWIEETPSFDDLYYARKYAEEVIEMITSLSECTDVPNRASDLDAAVTELKNHIDQMIYVDDSE